MNAERRAANALGGKTARACDGCLHKRARWFCAADDAFLCQACDASVHSANSLAQRHERVRLKTASLKPSCGERDVGEALPAWHQGFRRKARTPRHSKTHAGALLQVPKTEEPVANPPVVPELGGDELHSPSDENEEQLLYRVPIFDPVLSEFCTSAATDVDFHESKPVVSPDCADNSGAAATAAADVLPGFHPSDVDLAEFAADVESLLGTGMDEESFRMQGLGLGLLETKEEEGERSSWLDNKKGRAVKVKEEKEEEEEEDRVISLAVCHFDAEQESGRDTLDLNFDYASTGEEEEAEAKAGAGEGCSQGGGQGVKDSCNRMALRLNYDAVITAWASQGSPWTNGHRPQVNPDDCWHDFMSTCGSELRQFGGEMVVGGQGSVGDGGREARVSRYREKRRTRLFSKKIRYEVRKLNAEKRPRMKGRFVKRASFAGPPFPF